ncbi:MAG: hypothetical protein RLZZ198_284 [Bacteroidota bacterium]|jgi:hypothetical protein
MRTITLLTLFFLALTACTNDNTTATEPKKPAELKADTTEVAQPTVVPSGLRLKPFKFSDENCELASTEDFELDEGWCNRREVSGLSVSLNNSSVAQKINALICKEITGKVGNMQTIKRFVSDIKTLSNTDGEMEYIQDEYSCALIDSSNTYMSMGVSLYFYAMGAAHGQPAFQVLNVDLITGNKISLADLFVNNYRPSLKALAKRKFLEQNGNGDWWFVTGEQVFDLPETFAISRKGITFTYQPYEVGPYAAGAPEVFLSKKELAKWLKENPYLIP